MFSTQGWIRSLLAWALAVGIPWLAGCQSVEHQSNAHAFQELPPICNDMPRELAKTVLPPYIIEPPDVLSIETIHAVPRAPYRLMTLDVLSIQVEGTLPQAPIAGSYAVEPGGVVNLGVPYGAVRVAGLTVAEARLAIDEHLKMFLQAPQVAVALVELSAAQQLVGAYLVAPDGTVTLGNYGGVQVVGLTVGDAKRVIEQHLSQFLENPVVSLQVYAYNSKMYYVILQGAGLGDGVYKFPITGNETVLDAISNINGLQQVSSKRIWIARPTFGGPPQVMPVDWFAITEQGAVGSNYQILPGDRVFIAEDKMVAFDNSLAKIFAPLQRTMGFVLLGTGTATRLSGPVLKGGGNPRSNF